MKTNVANLLYPRICKSEITLKFSIFFLLLMFFATFL